MRTRKHNWFNTATLEVLYGLQVFSEKRKEWMHLAVDGQPFLAKTPKEQAEMQVVMRKRKEAAT